MTGTGGTPNPSHILFVLQSAPLHLSTRNPLSKIRIGGHDLDLFFFRPEQVARVTLLRQPHFAFADSFLRKDEPPGFQ